MIQLSQMLLCLLHCWLHQLLWLHGRCVHALCIYRLAALTSGCASWNTPAASLVGWACRGSALLMDSTCRTASKSCVHIPTTHCQCSTVLHVRFGSLRGGERWRTPCPAKQCSTPSGWQCTSSPSSPTKHACHSAFQHCHLHEEGQPASGLPHCPLLSQHSPQCLWVVLQPLLQRQCALGSSCRGGGRDHGCTTRVRANPAWMHKVWHTQKATE
jgi:hypothetical protein